MSYFQLPPEALRVGTATPFALRDSMGKLLVPRGLLIADEAHLGQLLARDLYVDEQDGESLKRAMGAKLDSMVRQNALIGRIAEARPDKPTADDHTATESRRIGDPIEAWSRLQMRLSALLRDPTQADFTPRLLREQGQLRALLDGAPDTALLLLVHGATNEMRDYSVNHAMLVTVVCELAARHIPAFTTESCTSLRCAALTMNVSMTQLQNQLALQDCAPSEHQRAEVESHAVRGAAALRDAGVQDELWLQAVEQHHSMPAGPLLALPAAGQLARLIQRADIFAARLSPRKRRPALSATAAAKAAFLDENQKPDEAGSAIIKATGIYPPGSLVRLASGEAALVLQRGTRANEPRVVAITNCTGAPLGEPSGRNTRLPSHAVTGGIAPHEIKVVLNLAKIVRMA